MKLRLKFKKTGRLKYIGHLDLLNIFNRAIKSAKIPVDYSKGFNPHMLISFASPLSVGIESICEYVDIDFLDTLETFLGGKYTELAVRINERFPDGLVITGVYLLETPYKRVASIVTKAEYTIGGFGSIDTISDESTAGFLAQQTIEIMKKTKRKNEITDIRPDIFALDRTKDGGISAVIACGSFQNLKPTLLVEAFCRFAKIETPIYKLRIVRTEIFGENAEKSAVPLSKAFVISATQYNILLKT